MTAKKDKKQKSLLGFMIIIFATLILLLVILGLLLFRKSPTVEPSESAEGMTDTQLQEEVHTKEAYLDLFDKNQPDLGITLESEGLYLEEIGIYDGIYVEDGTDEPVENITGIVVENTSSKMLEIAELVFEIQGQELVFQITHVLPGCKVIAMDLNKMTVNANDRPEMKSIKTNFVETDGYTQPIEAGLSENGQMAIVNRSENSYELVYVYYKNQISQDVYLGGITYRMMFSDVPGMTQIEADATHFDERSRVTNIEIIETLNHNG